MRRICMLLMTVLILAGCGQGGAGQAGNPQADPDAAHAAWVQALKNNDRQVAQQLLPTEVQMWVDRPLEGVRFKQDPKTGLGALGDVETRPVTAEGAGRAGVSVWHFQKRDECYLTRLSQQNGAWVVTDWQVQPCGG